MKKGAVLSPDGKYRFLLWRELDEVELGYITPTLGTCLFIMLNPSTADASIDDPTIRRCISFAVGWGYRRLEVVNLFPFRATDPKELRTAVDPAAFDVIHEGKNGDKWIWEAAEAADLVVCAWGRVENALLHQRALDVEETLRKDCFKVEFENGVRVFKTPLVLTHIGDLTGNGMPKHQLYLKKDLYPVEWSRT